MTRLFFKSLNNIMIMGFHGLIDWLIYLSRAFVSRLFSFCFRIRYNFLDNLVCRFNHIR